MTNPSPAGKITIPRVLLLALILVSAFTSALAERRERIVSAWRPLHYEITLTLNNPLTEITEARADITVLVLKNQLAVLDLDFGELAVDSVVVGSQPARYERGDGLLNITLPQAANKGQRLSVTVAYHGQPKDGLILKADKDGRPSATGDNWPNRVHHWIPCLDHPSAKATVNFTVTAPSHDLVVANGRLVGAGTNINSTTWSYQEGIPIPPYCMVIAVGEFALIEPPVKTTTPLLYYVPQSDRPFALQGFSAAAPSLTFLSQVVAPFPYEKLAHIVAATRFGGMENSSAIVYSSTLFNPRPEEPLSRRFGIRRGIVRVVAHETAHQWFGDAVTPNTWADLWLSEGFATYFAGVFIERYEGQEAFRNYMKEQAESYFRYERERRAPIYDRDTKDLFKLLNANNYQKGAWVLHMLRNQLGDATFFRSIRAYYKAHRNSTATTEDLRAALERASGRNLKEFFARWVYASGHPRYEVSWAWRPARARRGMLALTLRQLQADAPFLTPLPVEIRMAQGAIRRLLRPRGKQTIINIPLARRPLDVRIDPDEMILKEISVQPAQ